MMYRPIPVLPATAEVYNRALPGSPQNLIAAGGEHHAPKGCFSNRRDSRRGLHVMTKPSESRVHRAYGASHCTWCGACM